MAKATSPRPSEAPLKRKAKSEAAAPTTKVSAKPNPAEAASKASAPQTAKPAAPVRNEAATSLPAAPSHDAIAARAFELSRTRAAWEGSELGDWLKAEDELSN